MARYLALDAILPGDIILSSALTPESLAIRGLTGTTVASHAAIAIHPLIWFESADHGVRYEIIKPKLVWDGSRIRLGMEVRKGERYSIRRPNIGLCGTDAANERHLVAKNLISVSSRYVFLNYARPAEFLPMVRFGLGETAFARWVANNLDKAGKEFYPGPFCSWLVAECYSDLGRPIIDKAPNVVTPAALVRSKNLTRISSKIDGQPVQPSPMIADMQQDISYQISNATSMLSAISEGAAFQKNLTSLNDAIGKFVAVGWDLSGKTMPAADLAVLQEIEDNAKAEVNRWQTKTIEYFEIAYPGMVLATENITLASQCYHKCSSPIGTLACVGGCGLITQAFERTREEVYSVFPDPIDSLSSFTDSSAISGGKIRQPLPVTVRPTALDGDV